MSARTRVLLEAPRPAWIARRPNAHWYILGTVCVGAFMGQLDASIVTLALPSLSHDFHIAIGAVEWVSLSYLLVLVATVTAVGRAADIVGRKVLYVYGFGIFVIGSILSGLAPDLAWLIAARVLQALGAVMLQANSIALIFHALPRRVLGRGLGIQGAAQALGLAFGPAIGGVLVGVAGWRLIFFVNVPIGIVGMALGWIFLPRSRDLETEARFDAVGTMLFIPAAGGFLLLLSEAARTGGASPQVVVSAIAASVLTVVFLRRESRVRFPLIDLNLFRHRDFSAGISSGLLAYLVLFGSLFVIPFYLQTWRHDTAAQAGLQLTVLPIALAIAAPFAGRVADRVGTRLVAMAGLTVSATGFFLMAALPHGLAIRVLALALVGFGLGIFTPANNAAIMSTAPKRRAGMAGGILNMTRGFGTALGVAVTGLVYSLAIGASHGGQTGTAGFVVSMIVLGALAVLGVAISGFPYSMHLHAQADVPISYGRHVGVVPSGEDQPD